MMAQSILLILILKIKIDKKTYKDYTEYKSLHDVKPLYLVFSKLNGCIENHVENKSYISYK